ncbi:MAG: ABC transporter ATP-binding protein [Bacteroidota bacterium]
MAKPSTPDQKLTSVQYAWQEIVRPRWKMLALGLLLITINRAAGLVIPAGPKVVLDYIVPNQNTTWVWWLVLVLGGAIVIQSLTSFLLVRWVGISAQHLIAELRARLQQHVIQLPVRFFDSQQTGNLVSRIMRDVEGIRNLVGTGLVQMFGGILTAIGAFFVMLYFNVTLTLAMLVPMALFSFVAVKAFGRIRPAFRERGKIQAEVTGRLTESLGGVRVVKGFHGEQHEMNIFNRGVLNIFKNVRTTMTATALVQSTSTLIIGLSTTGALGYAAFLLMNGTMTAGDLTSFLLYLAVLVVPIVQMSNIGSQITEAFAGLDRSEELLQELKETDDPKRTKTMPTIEGNIQFEEVSFAYEEDKEVIHEVSFEAEKGSIIALVGSSGSGKSTIAGLAASFLTPQSGKILVDGVDLSTVSLPSYREQLGVVLQEDFLFEGSIRENILFSRPDATEAELEAAVKAAYVHEFSDRFEDGLETLVGERGVKLSGGQRQRIAIARALLANPRILILDEATSHLDTESETFIQKSLDYLLEGRTTFVIAHRLSTIRKADQILVIEAGRIAERGTHDELIESNGRYYDLYTFQSRI